MDIEVATDTEVFVVAGADGVVVVVVVVDVVVVFSSGTLNPSFGFLKESYKIIDHLLTIIVLLTHLKRLEYL